MAARKKGSSRPAPAQAPGLASQAAQPATRQRPPVPAGIVEAFLPVRTPPAGARIEWRPAILGSAKVHFADKKAGIDQWETSAFLTTPPDETALEPWSGAEAIVGQVPETAKEPDVPGDFAPLSGAAARPKSYEKWLKALKDHVFQTRSVSVWSCSDLKATSTPGETEGAFRARASLSARELRDAEVEAIRNKYASKLNTLDDRIRTAAGRVDREQAQVSQSRWQTATSFGSAILGALFGRRIVSGSSVSKASSAMRGFNRTSKEKDDVARAEESVTVLQQRRADLVADIEAEVARVREGADPAKLAVTEVKIAPRKTDITVGAVILVWTPWRVTADGKSEPAWSV